MYLIRTFGINNVAHIWDGKNTACNMFEAGGMKPENFKEYPSTMGKSICRMCQKNDGKPKKKKHNHKKGIYGSVSTLSNKLGNKGKLSKKSKKKEKLKANFYQSKEWRDIRYRALKLHGRQCLCCGAKPPNTVLHVDHIIPRSIRPDLELEITNLQVLCESCNLGKSNKDSIDYRINKPEIDEELDRRALRSSPL